MYADGEPDIAALQSWSFILKIYFNLLQNRHWFSAICFGDFTEVTPNYLYTALNQINNNFWKDSEKINAY